MVIILFYNYQKISSMKKIKRYQKGFNILSVFKPFQAGLSVLVVLFIFIHPLNAGAQSYKAFQTNASFAEKIYLQLDTKAYTPGNIIWYKCIVLNACDHVPSHLSRILYVELITPEEIVHEKKLINIEDGIGHGYFYLDKSLHPGRYMIRAYTQWDENFDQNFFFEDYIQVYANNLKPNEEKPISNVTLVKGAEQ